MDRAAICRVVDVFEHAQGLDYPAEFGQGAGEAGRGRAALQGAQDRRRDDGAGAQRGGEPADLIPMLGDKPRSRCAWLTLVQTGLGGQNAGMTGVS
jgi:hypothetical protein